MDVPRLTPDSLPWLTEAQTREVDRLQIEELGITLVQTLENAGRALADLALARYHPRTAAILAGSGGNGAGALVAARHLRNRGVRVYVLLSRPRDRLDREPMHQIRILDRLGVNYPRTLPAATDLIVDGLMGYGLRSNPRGGAAELIHWANGLSARTLALDLPSGLEVDLGVARTPCIHADSTLTLGLPKIGLRTATVAGDLFLADISVPGFLYERVGVRLRRSPFAEASLVQIAPAAS